MQSERVKSSRLRLSVRRVVALVVAVGCHVGLLMLVLRPATYDPDSATVAVDDAATLELRFISTQRPSAQPPLTTLPQVVLSPDRHRTSSGIRGVRRPAPVTSVVPLPRETDSTHEATGTPEAAVGAVSAAPGRSANSEAFSGDGGFQQRLHNAEHSNEVHGVPGSDRRIAPGMQLTDPMNQGIGAVMRNAQRLFGVANRHCIDVEVWQHLTPEELSARHLSPSDVNRVNEKYSCNRPMGLSF